MLTKEEINQIALNFVIAKQKKIKAKTKKSIKKWELLQADCINKLSFLVNNRTIKYAKFSNYVDLRQEAYEALLMALETFEENKGSFLWWADHYIKTKVYRAANAHSTIKVPMDIAKTLKPLKTSEIPVMLDYNDGHQIMSIKERDEQLFEAIQQLPDLHRQVVSMFYGINGIRSYTINDLSSQLNLSKNQLMKLLGESRKKIKHILDNDV